MPAEPKLRTRTKIAGTCAALLLVISFFASRSLSKHEAPTVESAASLAKSESERPRASTIKVEDSSSARELASNIDREIDESNFAKARWGVFVMSLDDGTVLYSRDGDRPITPASNMKLYTTAVALDLLGPEFRWQTSVYSESEPDKSGTIAGNIILYGRGAPDLSSATDKKDSKASLDELVDALYERGVRRVRGDVIGDESHFHGDPLGDGWLWNDVQWYFGAEVSALSINGNQIEVSVAPSQKAGEKASLKLKNESNYVRLENDSTTVERGVPATLGIVRGLSDNVIRVWGDFPVAGRGISAHLSVHQPALWAATLFREALQNRGITVDGKTRLVDGREGGASSTAPRSIKVELASVKSKSLAEIVRSTNKESINLYAELILRTLGKELGMTAPDPSDEKMRTRGDDEAGSAVIKSWLANHGIPTDTLAIHDGSGLSRLDLVTPETTARLLAAINRSRIADVFKDSLPIAGRDGTLKSRLRSQAGRILAKTGTVTYVNSLSGFATTTSGKLLAFSIICNDETSRGSSLRVIDKIAELISAYPAPNP